MRLTEVFEFRIMNLNHFSAADTSQLHDAVYEISSVTYTDEGSYTCQAANTAGVARERIQLIIEDDTDPRPEPDDRNPVKLN